jgi:crossover junction endodeoxyribonuclease RusA
MKPVRIILEWDGVPPSTNRVWRNTRGKTYLAPEVIRYRQKVAAEMFGALPSPWKWVGVDISISPPDRRRFDIDNRTKALFDALTHCGFWWDDECVVEFKVTRREPVKGGMTRLEIYGTAGQYRSDD